MGKLVFVPDEPGLGSVDEVHAVGGEVLPADFIGVVPQCSDLKHTHTHTSRTIVLEYLSFYCADLIKDGLPKVYCGLKTSRRDIKSLIHAWCRVFPVCHRALRRYSPGPVLELTSLIETPAVPKALDGFFSQ